MCVCERECVCVVSGVRGFKVVGEGASVCVKILRDDVYECVSVCKRVSVCVCAYNTMLCVCPSSCLYIGLPLPPSQTFFRFPTPTSLQQRGKIRHLSSLKSKKQE